ncbi:hypothetical protein GCM10023193_51300 [Planotetraspora kaengkrachanensis]|uniref:Uncharacterized protein n=1 Tax=Planotetraspora kaengkrachanensis TaxID=575193 RepID=A0A8J3PSY0_9ACTN|nr:hypothetical protein Pka01_26750 [Planotetraspora kaengkrachanensis]
MLINVLTCKDDTVGPVSDTAGEFGEIRVVLAGQWRHVVATLTRARGCAALIGSLISPRIWP